MLKLDMPSERRYNRRRENKMMDLCMLAILAASFVLVKLLVNWCDHQLQK